MPHISACLTSHASHQYFAGVGAVKRSQSTPLWQADIGDSFAALSAHACITFHCLGGEVQPGQLWQAFNRLPGTAAPQLPGVYGSLPHRAPHSLLAPPCCVSARHALTCGVYSQPASCGQVHMRVEALGLHRSSGGPHGFVSPHSSVAHASPNLSHTRLQMNLLPHVACRAGLLVTLPP